MASNSADSFKNQSRINGVNCLNDLHALTRRLESQFSFLTQHETCSVCSGYYGPCFGEPICATCHAFLFPEDLGQVEGLPIWESWKKDDGDSGNDEPSDPYFGPERRHSSVAATPSQPPSAEQAGPPPAPEAADPPPAPPPPENPPAAGAAMVAAAAGEDEASSPATPTAPNPPEGDQPGEAALAAPRAVDRLAEQLRLLTVPREPDFRSGFIDRLPPEVLLVVFRYLDDMSLCAATNVCKRWRRLLEDHLTDDQWQQFTLLRWPLFRPLYDVKNWMLCYRKLVDSAPCQLCLQQMALQPQPPGEENSWRRHRLRSELKNMRVDPPEGIQAVPLDRGCYHWIASILGPQGSPYVGGIFYLYVQVPYGYPMCPPVVRFITRIFHPNVSRHGDVGIDLIHHNWSLAMTVTKVLISVQSLLTDPFCQVCMEPSVGQLYLQDKPCFDLLARTWTWRYAMHDAIKPLERASVSDL